MRRGLIETKGLIRDNFSIIAAELNSRLEEHNYIGDGYFSIPFQERFITISFLVERDVIWPYVGIGWKSLEVTGYAKRPGYASYALKWLIAFLAVESDKDQDLALVKQEDINSLLALTRKYAIPFLKDPRVEDFRIFADREVQRVMEKNRNWER